MQFITITIVSLFLAAVSAAPAADQQMEKRTPPAGECGGQFGAPIWSFHEGGACDGTGYGCSVDCNNIVQCANGRFVRIASCGGARCGGNHNNGAVCY